MSLAILGNLVGILTWSLIAIGTAGVLCIAYGTFIERATRLLFRHGIERLLRPPASQLPLLFPAPPTAPSGAAQPRGGPAGPARSGRMGLPGQPEGLPLARRNRRRGGGARRSAHRA